MKRTAALQGAWLTLHLRSWARWQRALRDPRRAQARRLRALLPILTPTVRGREIGLGRVRRLEDLRHLPIMDGEELTGWAARIAAGEAAILSTEPVDALEPTGGSTGGTKLVPSPARLRAEFAEAVGVWMVDLHRAHPRLMGTRAYWSVSRAVRRPARTAGGVPIGLPDDASYFGPLLAGAVRALMVTPADIAASPTPEVWRRRTLTALVEAEDLGLISVWSPTFLTVLLDALPALAGSLPLSPSARSRLDRALAGGSLHLPTLWPRLAVVSAWGDGFARDPLAALATRLPGVTVQPKGLLATEGVVSFPLSGADGGALAVTSHVLELRDLDDGRIWLAHEAPISATTQPLLTTGGGLVRYALPDAVEVIGHTGAVPRIRLLGRLDRGSDRVGEKLTAAFVEGALRPLVSGFAALVVAEDPLRYVLVVDSAAPDAGAVDRRLRGAYHYDYARELGQLGAAEVMVVPDAWRRWEAAIEGMGLRLGDQKPHILEVRAPVAAALLDLARAAVDA